MTRLAGVAVVVLGAIVGCAEPALDGRDDSFSGKADGAGVSEGSPEAAGILALVNSASAALLKEQVGLHPLAAQAIVDHRAGMDKKLGTADDDSIDSLAELDAIEWIGPIALETLLTYWREHRDDFQEAWRAGLPTGAVDIEVMFKILVTDRGEAALETLRCVLTGSNPGRISISCLRDQSGFTASAVVGADGTFGIDNPATFDPRFHDFYMSLRGQILPGSDARIRSYRYTSLNRCPTIADSGGCMKTEDWVVRHEITGVEVGEGTLGVGCAQEPESPAAPDANVFVTGDEGMGDLGFCGACYRQHAHCKPSADWDLTRLRACVHDRIAAADLATVFTRQWGEQRSWASCGRWQEIGKAKCSTEDYLLCKRPADLGTPPSVPESDALYLSTTTSCKSEFRSITSCGYGLSDPAICLHQAYSDYVVAKDHSCNPGYHAAAEYACRDLQAYPYTARICLPDYQ